MALVQDQGGHFIGQQRIPDLFFMITFLIGNDFTYPKLPVLLLDPYKFASTDFYLWP